MVVVPTAAYCSEKYNETVQQTAEKGYKVSSYPPLVPTERIVKVFNHVVPVGTSGGLCSTVKKVQEKGAGDNGRSIAGRQSARFKHDEPKSAKDTFHTDEIDDKMQVDDIAVSVKKEDHSLPNKVSQEGRRSSISRPSREVTKKVQSYKEISVNVKMRRPE
ncbi:putative rubber elongation factor, shugoshin, shugoshin, plant [Helianthus annuus]|nr:putative rubber elongation factor, shugoshin, shugoshin, plant [Helianthus annuus]